MVNVSIFIQAAKILFYQGKDVICIPRGSINTSKTIFALSDPGAALSNPQNSSTENKRRTRCATC